jgi:penicillin-binding protein 1C
MRRPLRTMIGRLTIRPFAIATIATMAIPVVALVVTAAFLPLPRELREARAASSLRVTDRDGHLLREVRADDGARARWVTADDCGELVIHALVAAEDKRFYEHLGIDPLALARAALSDLSSLRVVSGGSTLTMQLARAVRPHARTLGGKFLEMALALRIEASLSKRAILEQVLNRVSFGPNLRGIAAASRAYFDKPPDKLSAAESALLVGLARGPSYYDLSKHADRATKRRNRVLRRMLDAGVIARERYETALSEPLVLQRTAPAFGAPHFVRGIVTGSLAALQPGLADVLRGPVACIETTLDASLQRAAEAAAARVPADLASKHVTATSILVVDNESGDVLAYVGSPDFFDVADGGQNDGVRALRQPGSTLKPFLYGLAMERLDWTGATVLPDIELHVPTATGDYTPRDYDEHDRGPVRLRDALGNSLNIPAVWSTQQVGSAALLERLRALGFASLHHPADYYGPGLALGDGEVTLLELVRSYATLARGGVARALRVVRSVGDGGDRATELPVSEASPAFPEAVAAQITDILRDHDARRASFGERSVLDFDFDVAAKTGTSKGYRDNWVVGFTRQVTVGVWVGNFDGSPMGGTSGVTGAGPLFHSVMDAAMRGRPKLTLAIDANHGGGTLRRVEVCALSGDAPGPDCPHRVVEWMPRAVAEALPACSFHGRVQVDRRNGLPAGPACARADVVDRMFERFPPEYAEWARGAGRPVVPDGSSPFCPLVEAPRDGDAALRIANLEDGARFAIDPDRSTVLQRLHVDILAPEHVSRVRLRVDGQIAGTGGAPFAFTWPLAEGDHELVAEADGVPSSPPLRVHVR